MPHYTDKQTVDQGMTRKQARQYADVRILRRGAPVDDISIRLNGETLWWERWFAPADAADSRRVQLNAADVAELCLKTEGGSWPSIAAAAEDLGVGSHSTATKLLADAVRAGLLETYDGPRGAVGHRIPVPKMFEDQP